MTSDSRKKENRSNELFTIGKSGRREDSDLHEQFFEDGTEEEDSLRIMLLAVRDGLDPDLAKSLYG